MTAKLICFFVFAYAKCWFSHDEAHIRFSGDFFTKPRVGQEEIRLKIEWESPVHVHYVKVSKLTKYGPDKNGTFVLVASCSSQ